MAVLDKRVFWCLLPWLVSIACLSGVLIVVPLGGVLEALRQVDHWCLMLAMLATSVNLLLRGLRSGVILRRSDPQSLLKITAISNLGLALNASLPGKLGEVARVLLLIKVMSASTGQAAMSALIERLADLVILSSLVFYGVSHVDLSRSEFGGELTAVADSLFVVSAFLLLATAGSSLGRFGKACRACFYQTFKGRPRFRSAGMRFMRDSRQIAREVMFTSVGLWSLGISLVMWLFVTVTIFLVAQAMPSIQLSFMSCLTIAAFTTLASSIPSAPGAWGTYEAAGMLVTKQLAPHYGWTEIGCFIFACHIAQYLPILLAGVLSWLPLKSQVSFSSLVNRNP